ncbi:MAG: hypothetical protein E6G14_00530 [Actinobacteria bacterium]|nr:MAG: hypothetical protein E6G14_00530 [Actinomycetota bacterium]
MRRLRRGRARSRVTTRRSSSSSSCPRTFRTSGPGSSRPPASRTPVRRSSCSPAARSRAAGPRPSRPGPFYCPLDHKVYLARNELDAGDTEEALRAAAAVGDDRLQQQVGQQVNPETWAHGSSAERTRWFRKGFDGGDPNACDTFSGDI